jgi:hypothetical protein
LTAFFLQIANCLSQPHDNLLLGIVLCGSKSQLSNDGRNFHLLPFEERKYCGFVVAFLGAQNLLEPLVGALPRVVEQLNDLTGLRVFPCGLTGRCKFNGHFN